MQQSIQQLCQLLMREGPLSSEQIQQYLGMSQPTASRLINRAGDEIVRIGRARATCYAHIRTDFGSRRIPIYSVNHMGHRSLAAHLIPLSGGGYFVEGEQIPLFMKGDAGNGLFDGLPYFLLDMRPQGYLGRLIARQFSSHYPENPERWSSDHITHYLINHGHDLPGNLILGELARTRPASNTPIRTEDRAIHYPLLAERAVNGELAGSSAGGEQPKFATCTEDRGHVIVKFSAADNSPANIRWRDLLIAEHLAHSTMAQFGMNTPNSSLFEFDGRLFLESRRFDRNGQHGRNPMLSLLMINAEFVGSTGSWIDVCGQLLAQKRLNHEDYRQVVWLQSFGAWIGNSDMHLGNLSLAPTETGFTLLPVYDMLPMRYAPTAQGEMAERSFDVPTDIPDNYNSWRETAMAAIDFWQQVAADRAVSDHFKQVAIQAVSNIKQAIGIAVPKA